MQTHRRWRWPGRAPRRWRHRDRAGLGRPSSVRARSRLSCRGRGKEWREGHTLPPVTTQTCRGEGKSTMQGRSDRQRFVAERGKREVGGRPPRDLVLESALATSTADAPVHIEHSSAERGLTFFSKSMVKPGPLAGWPKKSEGAGADDVTLVAWGAFEGDMACRLRVWSGKSCEKMK